MITSKTQLNAVIGNPIGHSKSPVLHNALYEQLGIDAVMLAFSGNNVRRLIAGIKGLNIGLTAVTIPFKQSVLPYLDSIDRRAKVMKSVNTIINKDGRISGYNTDIDGIALALKGVNLKGKNVLILGAGGAARAATYFCKLSKAKIFYFSRTLLKAQNLRREFGGTVLGLNQILSVNFGLIVNATPVGMHPNANNSPIQKNVFKKNQYVFDLVYNPRHTKFLKDAKSMGAKTISGVEMFVGQALKQIELYSGKKTVNLVNFAKNIL